MVIPCLTEKVGKFQLVTSKFSAILGVKSNERSIFQLLRLLKVMGCYISQLLDALKVTDCYIFHLFSMLKVMVVAFSTRSLEVAPNFSNNFSMLF